MSTNVSESAKVMTELMAQGKTMEEALAIVLASVVPTVPTGKVDRIALAESFTTLAQVEDALHRAAAKKSKSAVDSEARKRYEKEIVALKEKQNELRAKVKESEDPIRTAMELGKTNKNLVTMYLQIKKDGMELLMKNAKETRKMTNAQVKEAIHQMSSTMPDSLIKELGSYREGLVTEFQSQIDNNNQWAITYVKQLHFLSEGQKGTNNAELEAAATK